MIVFRTVIILFGIVLGAPLFLFSIAILFEGAANLAVLEFLWGTAGMLGYIAGCIALACQTPIPRRQQIRVSLGVCTGMAALLPVLINPYLFWLALGPMGCALALLVYLWSTPRETASTHHT